MCLLAKNEKQKRLCDGGADARALDLALGGELAAAVPRLAARA